jgi:uncharacterized YigZ family protein
MGEYREKGSIFISFSFSVQTFKDIKKLLNNLKVEYFDASHICYAYRIINNNEINEFSTDAGEPKGSSGIPILNQLKRHELVNTCIYIVRYFGGSKLGISGLINAYGLSALDAIIKSQVTDWVKTETFEIITNYESFGLVEKNINLYQGNILEKEFKENIKLRINIKQKLSIKFKEEFNELRFVKIIQLN